MYYFKCYGAKRLISEFTAKGWKKTIVNYFIKRLKETGSTTRKLDSGRPRTVRTVANISAVNDLVLNQEDAPQTHRTIRQIAREMGIHRSSVVRIIRNELHLKCVKKRHTQELTEANCITRLSCAKKLLRKFPESSIDFIFFTNEKLFTVAPPVNLHNDCVYAPCGTKKRNIATDRLLRIRPTFSHGVCRDLKTWMYWTDLCEAGSEGRRCLLPRCSAIAADASCNPTSGRRCVRVPARIARRPIVHVPQ